MGNLGNVHPLLKLIKRQSYNDYTKHLNEITIVLQCRVKSKRSYLVNISKEKRITHSFPYGIRNVIQLVHFDHLVKKCVSHFRIFRDEEEDHFADFISTGSYITYGDFLEIALASYKAKYLPLINFND